MIEQPLLSVCFPTRGRPLLLRKTLINIEDKLKGVIPIEICLRIDNDDIETLRIITSEEFKHLDIKYTIGERGLGYLEIYKYWEDLFKLATGTYILIWGDDAFIESAGDLFEILKKSKDHPCLIDPETRPGHMMNVFPIIHGILLKWLKEKYVTEDYLFNNIVCIDGYFEGLRDFFQHDKTLPAIRTTFKFHHDPYRMRPFCTDGEYDELKSSHSDLTSLKNLPEYKNSPLLGHPKYRIEVDRYYIKHRYEEEFLGFKK